jgi:hypothetical protein
MKELTKAQKFAVDNIKSANEAIPWGQPKVKKSGDVALSAVTSLGRGGPLGDRTVRFTAQVGKLGTFAVMMRIRPFDAVVVTLDELGVM